MIAADGTGPEPATGTGIDPGDVSTSGDDGDVGDDTTAGPSDPDTAGDGLDESSGEEGGSSGCPPLGDDPPGITECERDCGTNDFDVEHLSAGNYAGRRIHLLSPECLGPACPPPLAVGTYEGEPIVPCEKTPEAIASPRGPETYCSVSPGAATIFGLEIGFTSPPEPTSITVTRQDPAGPEQEPYLWRAGIVRVRGPGTEYNGRYEHGNFGGPDTVSDVRNLSCLANLQRLGLPYDPDDLPSACAATYDDDGVVRPLRMANEIVFSPIEGRLDSRSMSCTTSPEGPDTCCNACDEALSVAVAKYGVDGGGVRRSPNAGNAIACDPGEDHLASCRDFTTRVRRRREGPTFRYEWGTCFGDWHVPRYDKIRETHPSDRPEGVDVVGEPCRGDDDCGVGKECIGTDLQGEACTVGDDCKAMRCASEWFVRCRADYDDPAAATYCVDRRFDTSAAGACHQTDFGFEGIGGEQPAGSRLSHCDLNEDGSLSVAECCQPLLGDEDACDPLFQAAVSPIARHDRDPTLPTQLGCVCSEDEAPTPACEAMVQAVCEPPVGAATVADDASPVDGYAFRSVTRVGGTRYRAELDGFWLRLGSSGGHGRALTEVCAEIRSRIPGRSPDDSWTRARDFPDFGSEFDRAMCSSSTYTVEFAGPDDPEHVVSVDGDSLAGKQRYVFHTSEFLVLPDSGFPPENLNIDACDDVSLSFSNRYDLSVDNLRKLAIWRIEEQGDTWVTVEHIAGGRDCDPEATAGDVMMGVIPCLITDAGKGFGTAVGVRTDPEHGQLMQPGSRYRLVVPGLDDPAQIADPVAYVEAFHDACGMPLITGDLPEPEYEYDFTIDAPCPK